MTTDAVAAGHAPGRVDRPCQRAQPDPHASNWRRCSGVGEVRWATPIRKNAMAVPIKEKVDLLLGVNAAAMKAGADFFNSTLFLVNEQKYFASTDGSYIDQDVHRIWLPITATAVDKASGKFRTRNGLSAPMGMGYEYLDADPAGKFALPGGVDRLRQQLRRDGRRRRQRARRPRQAQGAVGEAGQVRPGRRPVQPVPDHPRERRPPARTRPRARLRGQLRRHQLRHARQARARATAGAARSSTSSPTRRARAASARSATTTRA